MKTIFSAAFFTLSASAAVAGGYAADVVTVDPITPVAAAVETGEWTGVYTGLSYGRTSADVSQDGVAGGYDMDADTFGLHMGYMRDYGRFVGGAEIGYEHFGNFDADGRDLGEVDGRAIRAKLIAGYDAGRFLPYAAISFADYEIDDNAYDYSDTSFGYGLGVKFKATEKFMVGAEWMRDSIEPEDLNIDLDTVNVSVSYRF